MRYYRTLSEGTDVLGPLEAMEGDLLMELLEAVEGDLNRRGSYFCQVGVLALASGLEGGF